MSTKRGDVVLVNAPFVTRSGSKIRPMLVVQKDSNNARMSNTIVAAVTSHTSRVTEPTQILIDISTSEGRQSGLLQNSAITCENLLTIAERQIIRTIATLPGQRDGSD